MSKWIETRPVIPTAVVFLSRPKGWLSDLRLRRTQYVTEAIKKSRKTPARRKKDPLSALLKMMTPSQRAAWTVGIKEKETKV